jgi:hypothetical protein
MADAADKIVKQLLRDLEKLSHPPGVPRRNARQYLSGASVGGAHSGFYVWNLPQIERGKAGPPTDLTYTRASGC